METASINFRVDKELKKKFDELAQQLGMNASTALNVFMRQFVSYGGFPFPVTTMSDKERKERVFAEKMDQIFLSMKEGHAEIHDLKEI